MAGELIPRDPSLANKQFKDRLVYWDKVFDVVSESQMESLAHSAINELDSLWAQRGLSDRECFIKGVGMWTETIPEDELTEQDQANIQVALPQSGQYTVLRYGKVVSERCISQGLSFARFSEEEKPSLAYQFLRKESYVSSSVLYDCQIRNRVQIRIGTLALLTIQEMEKRLAQFNSRFEPDAIRN